MDSVVDAGKYDGLFGVLTAIAAVKDLNARGKRLPFTFEVVAFGDEEGVRFGVSMIGSKALAGTFDPALLDKQDAAGITLRDALVAFGGDPAAIPSLKRDPRRVAAFIESHIEQGPVLLDAGLAVGVVTSIAGSTPRAREGDRPRRPRGHGADAGPPRCAHRRGRNGAGDRALLRRARRRRWSAPSASSRSPAVARST